MATSQTSLPHNTGPGNEQKAYQPGCEDFGLGALSLLPPDSSDAETDAAAPLGREDLGFDDPLQLECEQSGMGGVLPSGKHDFGMDALLLPEVRQFAGIDAAPFPEAQGDQDFVMGTPLHDQESFSGRPKAHARTSSSGQCALSPSTRKNVEMPTASGSSNSGAHAKGGLTPETQREREQYKALERQERNRFLSIFSDLREKHKMDPEAIAQIDWVTKGFMSDEDE